MRQLFEQRFDCRQIGHIETTGGRLDHLRLEPLANGCDVPRLGPERHGRPQGDDHEGHDAQLRPPQREAPRLDQHQNQDGGGATGDAVDRDIDERLGTLSNGRREREKEDLSRGPVDRVAYRSIHHAGDGWRPQGAADQGERRGHAKAHREHQQGEPDAEPAIDLLDEQHLNEQRGGREEEPHGC